MDAFETAKDIAIALALSACIPFVRKGVDTPSWEYFLSLYDEAVRRRLMPVGLEDIEPSYHLDLANFFHDEQPVEFCGYRELEAFTLGIVSGLIRRHVIRPPEWMMTYEQKRRQDFYDNHNH